LRGIMLHADAPPRLLRGMEMVAREGSAPSISGCRPDVILFHYRAISKMG